MVDTYKDILKEIEEEMDNLDEKDFEELKKVASSLEMKIEDDETESSLRKRLQSAKDFHSIIDLGKIDIRIKKNDS